MDKWSDKSVSDKRRDLHAKSRAKKERADCTVYALAVMLDGDYDRAHAALELAGRKHGRGAVRSISREAAESVGLKVEVVPWKVWVKWGKTYRTIARNLPKGRRFYVYKSGHVAAWDGGKMVDHRAGRTDRVNDVWEIKVDKPAMPVMNLELF